MSTVQIYTTKFCGSCVRAKRLLEQEGIRYEEIDISDTPEVREDLVEKTGEWTVPQIFVDGKYIGQDDELYDLIRNGGLK
ncbi:MAG TPA: glutaredoxin domain-containing protein [Nitrospiria bacterium]|nr:glutaredoxin domain-containing protein [Nitrospiria bacterium]